MDEASLSEAFQSWGKMDYSTFAQHWIGPHCTLIKYVRHHQGSLAAFLAAVDANGKTGESVIDSVLAGTASEDEGRVATLLTDLQEPHPVRTTLNPAEVERQRSERQFQRRQVRSLLRGFIYAALAADAFSRKLNGFSKYASQACQEFATAWPIADNQCLTAGTPFAGGAAALQNATPVTTRLHSELVGTAGYERSISSWLTVRRLIAYMVGEAEPPANHRSENPLDPFEVETRVLYAVDVRKKGQLVPAGMVKPLQVRSSVEGPAGCYFDPVALGITRIDRNMLGSVELAWRRIKPELDLRSALRMVPDVTPEHQEQSDKTTRIRSLEGGSAGGIFVCAMYAAATRTELNSDATTSICLKLPDDLAASTGDLLALDIGVVGEKTIAAKLEAAQSVGLIRVVLHQDQTGTGGTPVTVPAGLKVERSSRLEEVCKSLTGNARMERVLAHYSAKHLAEWEAAWTNPDDPDRLLYYVPPRYRLDRAQTPNSQSAEQRPDGQFDVIDLPTEEETLGKLLTDAGNRLCIEDDPGSGKTIFTRRVLAYLCGQAGRDHLMSGKPMLAVRWEEDSLDGSWPKNFKRALADSIEAAYAPDNVPEKVDEVVIWSLKNGRVVLILDALDQASDKRVRAFFEFLVKAERWRIRIIVTGRKFAVREQQGRFSRLGRWRFGGILSFTSRQQYQYFFGPVLGPSKGPQPDAWRSRNLREDRVTRLPTLALEPNADDKRSSKLLSVWFPTYPGVAELFGNPNAIRFARDLAIRDELTGIRNRAELYHRICRSSLRRSGERIIDPKPKRNELVRCEMILAAAAFEMMSQSPGHYRISGEDAVVVMQAEASKRLADPVLQDEWERVCKIALFTDRTSLHRADETEWAWPNRRMMEFYCGLHLAKNTQPGWVEDQEGQPLRCGDAALREHAGDPQWKEPFLYAMELPAAEEWEKPNRDRVLRASLAELFQPTAGAATKNRRPTELMFHAWGMLADPSNVQPHQRERQNLGPSIHDGQRVLQDFQEQFQVLERGGNAIARQLVAGVELPNPDKETWRMSFVLCPPQSEPTTADLTFAMGDEDARKVQVTLSPFWLQSTAVTVEQFALFDGQYMTAEKVGLALYAPEPTCPAIDVDWRDAYLFSYWVGGRLPTEAEWEYACRAGTATAYSFGGDESRLGEYAWYGENSESKTHPVAGRLPNGWGLYDLHGNVWEWCGDWYAALEGGKNPVGPATESTRVLRGGGWDYEPRNLRSGLRGRLGPRYRYGGRGFRVARSSVGAQ